MVRLEWLFFMQIVMGILMIVFLQKLTQIKKQMDKIIQEVSNYITYVTEDLEESQEVVTEENPMKMKTSEKNSTIKSETEEAKNRLIQAVLREYFP